MHTRKKSSKDRQGVVDGILVYILLVLGVLIAIIYNLCQYSALYLPSPDGDLYFSIAKNFLSTGHFIQTARPQEVGMVVPFGLPLHYTLLLCEVPSLAFVIAVQYVVFSCSGLFIAKILNKLLKCKIWGIIGALTFYAVILKLGSGNPAYLLTEVWSIFWSCFYLYMLTNQRERHLERMTIAFIILIIRPILCIPFVLSVIEAVWRWCKKKKIEGIRLYIGFVLLLATNMLVNFIEVGEPVIFQNYTGLALYQANNPNTKLDSYSSGRAYEFVAEDDYFWIIYNNEELTTGEKSAQYTKMAKEWMNENWGQVISNTAHKFCYMYVEFYGVYFWLYIVAIIYMFLRRQYLPATVLGTYGIGSAIMTSMGLAIYRYSIFIIPIFIVSILYLCADIILILCDLARKLYVTYKR